MDGPAGTGMTASIAASWTWASASPRDRKTSSEISSDLAQSLGRDDSVFKASILAAIPPSRRAFNNVLPVGSSPDPDVGALVLHGGRRAFLAVLTLGVGKDERTLKSQGQGQGMDDACGADRALGHAEVPFRRPMAPRTKGGIRRDRRSVRTTKVPNVGRATRREPRTE